ncbi:DUF5008 domain-containing protein [Sphingobacterium sp. SGG-5]|uniref:DUF5008 domain-containing protein n=1 Tax=Sphingobacterium sp. SGG-5 TaxID=2710881 RepID=UPI0013E9F15A|nr:DUF5008 domain-containing protein [Sphingobacterium sp. SGG-5]NGM62513.1 DUF5008 domain-containing protein [Sphingobacterium sp. SGG-5]
MKILKYILFSLVLLQACKDPNMIGEDPYAGGKEALGIKFKNANPSPSSGNPGDEILFKVQGLEAYRGRVAFYINEELADIVDMTDSTIRVIVPELVSTGGASIVVDGQVIFGPRFVVNGKIGVNSNYNLTTGFGYSAGGTGGGIGRGTVFDYARLSASSYVYTGLFTDYNSLAVTQNPINGLVNLNNQGDKITTVQSFLGVEGGGYLTSVHPLADGKLIVSGSFSTYEGRALSSGITRLQHDGKLDTMSIRVINETENPLFNLDTVPAFNGNILGEVRKSFLVTEDGKEKIICIGNFSTYYKYRYDFRPTRENRHVEYRFIDNVIRLETDGTLDSAYNYDLATQKGVGGANGIVFDAAIQEEDNKVILVGKFTKFQDKDAPSIVRIDQNGLVDPSFAVGTGANGMILSIQRANGKILLTGLFSSFNGVACNGVVMLNTDGSVVPTFQFRNIDEGVVTFAKLLDNGKVLVSGSFGEYDNVKRSGLLFLEQDGTALQEYNNVGSFEGTVYNVYETMIAARPSVVIMGSIRRFDNKDVSGLLVLEVKD